MKLRTFASTLVLAALTNAQCNPLTNNTCPQINGLNASTYEIDFTKQTSLPANWTLADQATVKYGDKGAEFTFAKRYDAPYIWTSFYMLFGKIEVTMQAAPGQGIVSGVVMMSDDLDEIDWEWSGSNFNSSQGKVQTNYFGKGLTGNYDRGTQPNLKDDPTKNFHTYTVDWKQDSLTWSIDGSVVRQLSNNGQTSGSYQYPQTPSRLHLGLWNGGDDSSDWGVIAWVGGKTDLSKAPYTAYVKSVKITNYTPCSSWQYLSGFSGKWQDVKCTNQTVATATMPTSTPKLTPANLPCNYTVTTNDTGANIANKLGVSFSDLNITNQPINWDKLLLDQVLKVPGGNCANGTTPMPSNSTTSSNSSIMSLTSTTSTSTSSSSSSSTPSSTSVQNSSSTSSSSISSTSGTSSIGQPSTSSTATSNSTVATPTPTACNITYTVAAGDFGNKIAGSFGIYFNDLSKVNPGVNWDGLNIGQPLNIPSNAPFKNVTGMSNSCNATALGNGTTCGLTYKIQQNDYGNGIAQLFGIYFNDLKQANPSCDWDKLKPGQVLIIPGKPSKTPTTGVGSSACLAPATNTTAFTSTSSGYNPATVVAGNPTTSPSTSSGTISATSSSMSTTSSGSSSSSSTTSSSSSTSPSLNALGSTGTVSPLPASASGAVSPSSSVATACGYQVAVGDYGYKISEKLNCTFQALNDTNPGVDWNKLLIGAVLIIPGSPCARIVSSSSSMTSSSSTMTFSSSSLSTVQTSSIPLTTSSSSSSSASSSSPTSASPASSSSTSTASSTGAPSSPTSSLSSLSTSSSSTTVSSSSSTSSTTTTSSSVLRCNKDNCLNNLIDTRYSSSAYQFCTAYLTPNASSSTTTISSFSSSSSSPSSSSPQPTLSVAIPSWLGNCKNDASRVSSACMCLCKASAASISSTLYHYDMNQNRVVSEWGTKHPMSSSSTSSSLSSSSSMPPSSSSSSLTSSAPSSSLSSLMTTTTTTTTTTGSSTMGWGYGQNQGAWAVHGGSSDNNGIHGGDAGGRGSWGSQGQGQGQGGHGQQYGTGNQWKREAAPEAAPEPADVTLAGGEKAWAAAAQHLTSFVQSQAKNPMPTRVPPGSAEDGRGGLGMHKREMGHGEQGGDVQHGGEIEQEHGHGHEHSSANGGGRPGGHKRPSWWKRGLNARHA